MVCEAKSREVYVKLLPNWHFCGVDSIGLSRGFLTAWNPRKADFVAFLTPAGIFLEGVVKDLNLKLKLINCYGSYANREVFWEDIKREGILDVDNLILGVI